MRNETAMSFCIFPAPTRSHYFLGTFKQVRPPMKNSKIEILLLKGWRIAVKILFAAFSKKIVTDKPQTKNIFGRS